MRRCLPLLLAAGLLACGERTQEQPAVAYGATPTTVVVRVWVADTAYDLEFVRAADTSRDVRIGRSRRWLLGAATMGMSPLPERPDYYAIFPGDQAIATERAGATALQYDIFAAVVLDPTVPVAELRSASTVLRHANEPFEMPAAWTLDSVPGGAALQDELNFSGMQELTWFRNPDGSYPRILLVAQNVAAPIRRFQRPQAP